MADAAEMLTGLDSHVVRRRLRSRHRGRDRSACRMHRIASVAEVARARALRLRDHGLSRRSRLGRASRASAFVPSLPHEPRGLGDARGDPRHDDQPLPLLLAGVTGGRGGEGARPDDSRAGAGASATRESSTETLDVGVGTFFSNLVMFFIILTTAVTLHRHGVTNIETSRQAAEALRPLAGNFAATLFTLGVVGVGLLAIPTLAGSAAYAFAETFGWRQGLDQKMAGARRFYFIVGISTAAGIALDFAKVSPLKALYWSAVVNGLLAPVSSRRRSPRRVEPQADGEAAEFHSRARGGGRRDSSHVRGRDRNVRVLRARSQATLVPEFTSPPGLAASPPRTSSGRP